nr:four helix bundle protein [Myxosarcina sp. GI1]
MQKFEIKKLRWDRICQNEFMTMTDKPFDICERTFQFSVRVVNLCCFLNKKQSTVKALSNQLIRSGTSIGANVEESRAAQSTADFIHKLEIALKEARETRYWIRLLIATNLIPETRLLPLLNEINELMNILASMIIKAKENRKK